MQAPQYERISVSVESSGKQRMAEAHTLVIDLQNTGGRCALQVKDGAADLRLFDYGRTPA